MYGLYIHIPFCRSKCNYCDFVSKSGQENLFHSYVKALSHEMKKYSGVSLTTVFFGGGTPTLLFADLIDELFHNMRKSFDCQHISEITFESNPESLYETKLMVLKKAGVNRISVGAQSFCNMELEFLGRAHSVEDFDRSFQSCRKMRFSNINIDLIYGLPEQTLPAWKKNLEKTVSYDPEHISLYPLTIEPGTLFAKQRIDTNGDNQAEMYEWSMEFLSQAGYDQYEISNWSRPGFKCRHNLIYWENKEYLGLGVAAASHLNGKRWRNCLNTEDYIAKTVTDNNTAEDVEVIDPAAKLSEEIILKLRLRSGICISGEIEQKYGGAINRLLENKLLEKKDSNIRLTKKGMYLSNIVFNEFV